MKTRLIITTLLALLLSAPALAQDSKDDGFLIVPEMVGPRQSARHPGFVAPFVWVYDETGAPIRSKKERGAFDVGEMIQVAPGWYLLEVGNVSTKENRVKMFVAKKKVTVVPSGLVAVWTEDKDSQPRDVCARWTGKLFVSLPIQPKPGPTFGTNQAVGEHPVGIVQVVAGYYTIQWNGFYINADVKAGQVFHVPTGLLAPMPHKGYTLHKKKGLARGNPGVRTCAKRPTRVIARTYQGTYNRQITVYPYKQRVWEQLTVEIPEQKNRPYEKWPHGKKVTGRHYKGPHSAPIYVWELEKDELPPMPTQVPQKLEADGAADKKRELPATEGDKTHKKRRLRGLPEPTP